jgi:hypothetical protein
MSQPSDDAPIELHLFSETQTRDHVELLTVIAHYSRTGSHIGLGDTVNFGRPWLNDSSCCFGLISLPYLDGPKIERFAVPEIGKSVQCLWLVPITESEREFKKIHGIDAIEQQFEQAQVNYLDPHRRSVV